MIMQELLKPKYKKAPYIFTSDSSTANELYQEAYLRCVTNERSMDAYQNGNLLTFFVNIIKFITFENQRYRNSISFDADLSLLEQQEVEENNIYSRLIEADLMRCKNEHDRYFKKLIQILIYEGSIYKASKVTGIRIETFTKALETYVRNYKRNISK